IGGDVPAQGICGSGLVDAAAQLVLAGLLDHSGRLLSRDAVPDHPLAGRLIEVDGIRAFEFADGVYLTQKDIRELQFAKGSIATGIKVLMDIMGVGLHDLDQVLLGGSFGSYLHPGSARIIGLVPRVDVYGVSALLHLYPDRIVEAVRDRLRALRPRYRRLVVVYGDCGTFGKLEPVLEEFGAARLPGPHCYEMYAGAEAFGRLAEEQPATFFLTDWLVRNFERAVVRGLGLDRHP